jgi:hypothetical protein
MEDFSLNDNGELFIRWNINTAYTKLTLNELISLLIQEYKHTGGVYDAFVRNDGKLIGNEKVVIIRNMRDIIQLTVVIKNLLLTKYIDKKDKFTLLETKFLDEYSFQVSYKFKPEELDQVKSVRDWYDNYFKVHILSFTEDMKLALEDKIITSEEAIGLSKTLDEILLSAVVLHYKLMHENIVN